MYRQNEENIGRFIEKEFKHEFTYRNTKDKWAIAQGYRHEIDCGFNGEIRFRNVKKIVVYVLCDDLDGNAVAQKWILAKCTMFKTVC